MENHIKPGMAVDFFGLPGSGKTTIAHRLARVLEANGYEVQETIYRVNNESNSMRRIGVKMWAALCFSITHYSYMHDLFALLGKGSFLTVSEAIKQWVNVCFVITNINKGQPQDINIADQGIAQAALSLTYRCENADVVKIVTKLKEQVRMPIRHVYIRINTEKVLERLEIRRGNKARVDIEKSKDRKIMQLQEMQTRCNEIAAAFDCIAVDNNRTYQMDSKATNLDDLVDMIVDFITSPLPSI